MLVKIFFSNDILIFSIYWFHHASMVVKKKKSGCSTEVLEDCLFEVPPDFCCMTFGPGTFNMSGRRLPPYHPGPWTCHLSRLIFSTPKGVEGFENRLVGESHLVLEKSTDMVLLSFYSQEKKS